MSASERAEQREAARMERFDRATHWFARDVLTSPGASHEARKLAKHLIYAATERSILGATR